MGERCSRIPGSRDKKRKPHNAGIERSVAENMVDLSEIEPLASSLRPRDVDLRTLSLNEIKLRQRMKSASESLPSQHLCRRDAVAFGTEV